MDSTFNIWLTLLTVIGTGLGAAFLTQRSIRRRDEIAFKRAKLEEFFELARTEFLQRNSRFQVWKSAMKGEISLEEAHKEFQAIPFDETVHGKATLIAAAYFPRLRWEFFNVCVSSVAAQSTVEDFQSGLPLDKDHVDYVHRLNNAVNTFLLQEAEFFELLFAEAATLHLNPLQRFWRFLQAKRQFHRELRLGD